MRHGSGSARPWKNEGLKTDTRFATNESRLRHRDELVPLLEAHFKQQSAEHWVNLLEKPSIAVAPIPTVAQVLEHPQVLANAMVVAMQDASGLESKGLGVPFKIEDGGGVGNRAAPSLGEHSDEILQDDLGFSAAEIATHRQGGTESETMSSAATWRDRTMNVGCGLQEETR